MPEVLQAVLEGTGLHEGWCLFKATEGHLVKQDGCHGSSAMGKLSEMPHTTVNCISIKQLKIKPLLG